MNNISYKNNIISEKSVFLAPQGKYILEVDPKANKSEIKKQIEKNFKVKITKINNLNYSSSKRLFKGIPGKTPSFKKMIITLKKGQKIREFEIDTKEEKTDKKDKPKK